MRMLLLSSTLTNETLKQTLLQMLSKPPKDHKILIINQVQYVLDQLPEYTEIAKNMVKRDKEILTDLGFSSETINIYDVVNIEKPNLHEVDLLWIQGGNNFYYLQQIREKGYMEDIRGFIEKNGVYVGTSAGSMMMSPSVDVNLTMDENLVELEDVTGFGIIPFFIVPHWDSMDEDVRVRMLGYAGESGKKVISLTDQQGILVTDKETRVI